MVLQSSDRYLSDEKMFFSDYKVMLLVMFCGWYMVLSSWLNFTTVKPSRNLLLIEVENRSGALTSTLNSVIISSKRVHESRDLQLISPVLYPHKKLTVVVQNGILPVCYHAFPPHKCLIYSVFCCRCHSKARLRQYCIPAQSPKIRLWRCCEETEAWSALVKMSWWFWLHRLFDVIPQSHRIQDTHFVY